MGKFQDSLPARETSSCRSAKFKKSSGTSNVLAELGKRSVSAMTFPSALPSSAQYLSGSRDIYLDAAPWVVPALYLLPVHPLSVSQTHGRLLPAWVLAFAIPSAWNSSLDS